MKSPIDSPETSINVEISNKIRSTGDTHELLDLMTRMDKNDLEPHHLSQAFSRLFTLHKIGYNSIHPSQLTNHTGFDHMCHMLKFKAPRMDVNDLVASLKVLNFFGLTTQSLIVQRILHLIKDQINDLGPNNLLFLSFLLSKMKKTPLTEALAIAIPIVFDLNLSLKIDHNKTTELTEMLNFVSSSPMKISKKSMTSIITALTLHGKNLSLQEARSVIWSFTSMRIFDPSYEKLFNNCMKILNTNYLDLTFEELESTVTKMMDKFLAGGSLFYNEQLLNNCAKYVIKKDVGDLGASYILKKFNRICFVNHELLDYIDRTIVSNHSLLSNVNAAGLLTFSNGFSNANYKSENWEIIKSLLHENPLFQSQRLPWMKFAVEMMSLDFHSNILFEKVFSTKFLTAFLKRDDNALDYVQLLLLWQSVKLLIPDYSGPLPDLNFIEDAMMLNQSRPVNEGLLEMLAYIFGGREYVQSRVMSSHGHCLDFVISFDANENPIAMPCAINTYDDLLKSQVKPVAVFFNARTCFPINHPNQLRGKFDLKYRTIAALGIKSAHISMFLLNNLPENEKTDYINNEVRKALR